MFSLTRFTDETIREHLARQARQPFSYAEVGASNDPSPPPGYTIDHNRVLLGHGASVFERACDALRRWEMFNLGWVQLCWPSTPIAVGATVGVLVYVLRLWSLNACRVVYTLDDEGEVKLFGFAYGTLPDHAERGEERFSIQWERRNDSVWYDLRALSRPHLVVSRIGYPYTRRLQRRFAAESLKAMVRAAT